MDCLYGEIVVVVVLSPKDTSGTSREMDPCKLVAAPGSEVETSITTVVISISTTTTTTNTSEL